MFILDIGNNQNNAPSQVHLVIVLEISIIFPDPNWLMEFFRRHGIVGFFRASGYRFESSRITSEWTLRGDCFGRV